MTLQRISFWLLWAFIFTVPWENQLLISSNRPVSTVTALAALSVGIIQITTHGSIRFSRLHGALAFFVLLSAVSSVWSLDPANSIDRFVTIASLFAVSVVAYNSVRYEHDVRLLMLAYVLGCVVAVGGGMQSFAAGISYGRDRFVADGFDPNDMAVTLAIGIPFSIYLAMISRQLWKALFFAAGLGALVIGIGLTASRGGAIATAFGLTSIVALFRGDVPLSKKLLVALLIVLCAAVAVQSVPVSAWDRILTIQDEANGGDFAGRKQVWVGGLDQFSATPILGVGSGAFATAMAQRIGTAKVAHNTYLTIAVELGIGGVLLMLLIAFYAYSEYRFLPQTERWIWFGVLAAWGAGVFSLTWDYHKPTWIVVTLLAAHCATHRHAPAESLAGSYEHRSPYFQFCRTLLR